MHLRDSDIGSITRAQSVLLTPFAHATPYAWGLAVNAAARAVVGADRAAFVLPGALIDRQTAVGPSALGCTSLVTRGPTLSVSDEFSTSELSDYPRCVMPLLTRLSLFERSCALGATSRENLVRTASAEYYRSSYYQDYLIPARAIHCVMLAMAAPSNSPVADSALQSARGRVAGPHATSATFREEVSFATTAQLLLYHDQLTGRRPRAELVALLRVLYPAFRAGVESWWALGALRQNAVSTLDALGVALSIHDASGRSVHRTPSFERMLAEEQAPAKLHAAVQRAVRKRSGEGRAVGALPRVTTPTHVYRVRSVSLDGLLVGNEASGHLGAVIVERLTTTPPSPAEVGSCLGLTPAQSAVALLVAAGHTNAEIARLRGLSAHTVRHHIAQAFVRVGADSRSGLALRVHTVPRVK